MHLSKTSVYRFRTTINRGIAADVGRKTVSGAELAEANRLPLKFEEPILQELCDSGIVETHHGKFGGCPPAKPAEEIGIGQIFLLIDSRLAPICFASENAYQPWARPERQSRPRRISRWTFPTSNHHSRLP